MNVKIFFVKHYKEYFSDTKQIFQALGLQNFGAVKDFNIPVSMYSQVVQIQHKKIYQDLNVLYGGELFCETGIEGLKIDFNFGLRLDIPEGNFHARISDFDSGTIFFDEDISNCRLISSENYFINWQVEIFASGEKVFEHILNLKNQLVLIVLSNSSPIGDTLALLPYVREFQKVQCCKIFLYLPKYLRELVKILYPEIVQVEKVTQNYYATFYLSSNMGAVLNLPADSRTLPLEKVGGIQLGLENVTPPLPKFLPTADRKILEPYVCIAVQASTTAKTWLYPKGWDIVIDYLKSLGYRVLCIDKNKKETDYGYTVEKPKGAEDFTGNIPLIDRANMLYYAEFFIGLGSGLSWLANAVSCPVILISGFSQDWCEFPTVYRIANRFVCNGCFNDANVPTFMTETCWRYAGTSRELECQKKISPHQVLNAIENLIIDKNLNPPALQ